MDFFKQGPWPNFMEDYPDASMRVGIKSLREQMSEQLARQMRLNMAPMKKKVTMHKGYSLG